MLDLGSLQCTLGVETGPLRKAEGDLRAFGASADTTFGRAGAAASSCASQMGQVLGVTLSLVGAYAAASKAVSSWYSLISSGISIVDDYQKKIIGTSYILTTMSDVKPPDLTKAYGQWKEYFQWTYEQSLRVDKMAASAGMEIQSVTIELAKKGVVAASEEEMNTIGRLTDLMKAVTPGYMNFEQQARGEIMSMVEGTARMGAQTAQILSQIDPAFKENIKSAREQGTVLKYIESILPQIKQYTLDLMGTWDAVGSSLKSAWSVINLSAFGDAHREVVDLAGQLSNRLVDNGKLTADGEKAALALGRAWSSARDRIFEAFDYVLANSDTIIKDIGSIASGVGTIAGGAASAAKNMAEFVQWLKAASENPLVGTIWGAAAGSRLGPWGAVAGGAAGFVAAGQRGNEAEVARGLARSQTEFQGYEVAGEGLRSPFSVVTRGAPPTPPVRPLATGETGGKGGGAGGGADAIQKEMEKINKEVEKARKDAINAENEAFNMVWKLKQDTAAMYAEATANQYEIKGLYKSSYDTLGSISPIMGDQIGYQKKALDLQMEIEKYTLDRKIHELGINKAQADELRGLQALTSQAKKFNAEMEADKGIRGWAYSRSKEAEGKNTIKDMMGGLESGLENSFSSAWQGFLTHDKKSLKKAGESIFQGLIGEVTKGSITRTFSGLANILKPKSPMEDGGQGLETAGKVLSDAGGILNQAGLGFNLNTLEFGAAAGGLLLSGIGIATNSQFLVYAGMVLQIAGMAIQIYQALASTSQIGAAAALVGSAGALTAAAGALIIAAEVETATSFIPGFHSGGMVYAHRGWPPPKPGEVDIRALDGERVLNVEETQAYNAGFRPGKNGGGGNGGETHTHVHYHDNRVVNAIDARGVEAVLEKHGRTMVKTLNRELGKHGKNPLGKSYG